MRDQRLTSGALWALTFAVTVIAAGCEGDPQAPVYEMELVTPGGDAPLEGIDRIRVRVAQEGEMPLERESTVGGDGFEVDAPLADALSPVRLSVELTGPDRTLIGAPPPFVPLESEGLVRIAVAPPGTCGRLSGAALPMPAAELGLSLQGTFALAIGGRGLEDRRAAFLDLLRLEAGALREMEAAVGAAKAVPLARLEAVVVGEETAPLRYDLSATRMPTLPLDLHDGAGVESGLLGLGDEGAVVVGGATDEGPVDGVTWVRPDGALVRTRLTVPRQAPAVAPLADGAVLVVGGTGLVGAGEAPSAEIVERGAPTGRPLALDVEDGLRRGALLVSDGDGRALLLGGTDAEGAVRLDTIAFRGCPEACAAERGPEWPRARLGVAFAYHPTGGAWLAGGEDAEGVTDAVDRVHFGEDGPAIEALEGLEFPRRGAAAIVTDLGVAYVVGGRDAEGPRDDVEVCLPQSLGVI